MLGISGKAVSKWERELSKPCDEHQEKLVELFGLPTKKDDYKPHKPLGSSAISLILMVNFVPLYALLIFSREMYLIFHIAEQYFTRSVRIEQPTDKGFRTTVLSPLSNFTKIQVYSII